MRVAIDARKLEDFGIGTYIRGLLGGLATLYDHDEYVVLAPAPARDRIPAALEHIAVDAPNYSITELFRVGAAGAKTRADVIHAPHYVVPFTAKPVVTTIHDLIHLRARHANPIAPLYARTMLGRAVRKSARILTVTDAVRRDIVRRLGCAEEKIVVTPNGVDPRFSAAGPKLQRDRPYFLFVGNDKPHKNCERLVEAFGRTSAAAASDLLLAGGNFVRFTGRASTVVAGFVADEELPALYRGATAVVVPSLDEGFGLPALEAMACGVPVITSTAPALVEVTAGAALHVDGIDVDAIAAAIDRIASDGALRGDLASRGVLRASQFTWRRCAELTRDAYRAAIE
jgi:glycosyltransferase involved in cell wall biosynthesis